jgi:hypothetical protein
VILTEFLIQMSKAYLWLCVYSDWRNYLLKVLKIDMHSKIYYGVRVNCFVESRN